MMGCSGIDQFVWDFSFLHSKCFLRNVDVRLFLSLSAGRSPNALSVLTGLLYLFLFLLTLLVKFVGYEVLRNDVFSSSRSSRF